MQKSLTRSGTCKHAHPFGETALGTDVARKNLTKMNVKPCRQLHFIGRCRSFLFLAGTPKATCVLVSLNPAHTATSVAELCTFLMSLPQMWPAWKFKWVGVEVCCVLPSFFLLTSPCLWAFGGRVWALRILNVLSSTRLLFCTVGPLLMVRADFDITNSPTSPQFLHSKVVDIIMGT